MADAEGPATFPIIIAVIIAICLVWFNLRPTREPVRPSPNPLAEIGFAVAVCLLQAILLAKLSLLICTARASAHMSWRLGGTPVGAVVTGLGPSVGIRVVFKLEFGLSLAVCLLGRRLAHGVLRFTRHHGLRLRHRHRHRQLGSAPRVGRSRAASGAAFGTLSARPLLVLGDDIPSDLISRAGWIDPTSAAGTWPIGRGGDPENLNVCASYRGHWEGMLRGRFTNRSANSHLNPDLPPAQLRARGSEELKLHEAVRFEAQGSSVVSLAGERYGMGSNRDRVAKGAAHLRLTAEQPGPLLPWVKASFGMLLGAPITPSVPGGAVQWWWSLLRMFVVIGLGGMPNFVLLLRVAKVSRFEATLCPMPERISGMILLGEQVGADQCRVSIVHTLRIGSRSFTSRSSPRCSSALASTGAARPRSRRWRGSTGAGSPSAYSRASSPAVTAVFPRR